MVNIPVIHCFQCNGRYYIYDANSNSIFEVSKSIYKDSHILLKIGTDKFLLDYKDSDINYLFHKGYLRCPEPMIIRHPHYELIESLLDNRISHIVLQVTKECNFKCRYCSYAGTGDFERKHQSIKMTVEVAQKAIDYLYEHSGNSDKINICFYGGEPLLNWELVKYVLEYGQKLFASKQLQFHMTTNASLLNDEVLKVLQNSNVNLLVSLDGPKQIQDRHRLFLANGAGTYDIVMKNIKHIMHNYSMYFSSHVAFNPVMLHPNEENTIMNFFLDELGVSAKKIRVHNADLSGLDYVNDYDKVEYSKGTNIMDDEFENNISVIKEKSPLRSPWQHNGPCIPGVDRLFVSCEGLFFPCEKIPEISCVGIGNVHDGICIQKVQELASIGQLTTEECAGCWAKRFCRICLAKCIDFKNNCISRDLKMIECKKTRQRAEFFLKKYVELEQTNALPEYRNT